MNIIEVSHKLQAEFPRPSETVVDALRAKYQEETHEDQDNYFKHAIDIHLRGKTDEYHTTDLLQICIRAIDKGIHNEIIVDLFTILSWKTHTLAHKYTEMTKTKTTNSHCIAVDPFYNNKDMWYGLFQRSYAGGNIYPNEYYDHKISRLVICIFHLSRLIKHIPRE